MAGAPPDAFSDTVYHRDYVIRLIQQFIVILARLAGLKAKDDPQVILLETETALRTFTGLDPELVRSLSAPSLGAILTARDTEDHTALAAAAILLKTEGDAYVCAGNRDTAFARFKKTLVLLDTIDERKVPEALREHLNFRAELERFVASETAVPPVTEHG